MAIMEIKNCTTLKELFDLWKIEHKNDKNWENTFPKCPCCGHTPSIEFKNSFCKDGFLNNNNFAKVLFICRESNLEEKVFKTGENDDTFWMYETKNTKYHRCCEEILKHMFEEKIVEKYTVDECAYMNINKRGGYKKCSMDRLSNYAKKYKDFILKEIELIDSDIIVLLGGFSPEVTKIINECNKKIYLYGRHPSVYHKNIGKYWEEICN